MKLVNLNQNNMKNLRYINKIRMLELKNKLKKANMIKYEINRK